MAILLEEEKVVKIVKFDFLVKMKLLLEMALDHQLLLKKNKFKG
jgi:hypothetical protein